MYMSEWRGSEENGGILGTIAAKTLEIIFKGKTAVVFFI